MCNKKICNFAFCDNEKCWNWLTMQFLYCNVFENVFYRILKTQSLCIIMTMCTIINIMNLSSRLHAWINLILERYPAKVSNQLLTMLIKEQKSNMRKLLEYWPILSSVSSFQKTIYMHLLFTGTAKVSRFYPFVQIQNIEIRRFEIKPMKMNLIHKENQLKM